MEKERKSNMELLRVIAMLMIVAYHIYCHSIIGQLSNVDNALLASPAFFKKLMAWSLLSPLGQVGNTIFITLSGFFLVPQAEKLNLLKTSKKLIFQQVFATITLIIVSTVIYSNLNGVNNFYPKMINITHFNDRSWFVGYYFAVVVIAKLFLNKFLNGIDKKKYATFLLVMFVVIQASWTNALLDAFAEELSILFTGVFLYSLGGFIKKYNPFDKVKIPVLLIIIVFALLLIFQLNYNEYLNMSQDFNGSDFFAQIKFRDSSVIPILLGVTIFEIFRRINIKTNKVINYLGASTFMVYLLHDNNFVRSLWNMQNWGTLLFENSTKCFAMHIVWTIATFAVGALLYALYAVIEKSLRRVNHGDGV